MLVVRILKEKSVKTILERNKYKWEQIAYDKKFHSRIWTTLFLSEDEGVNQLEKFKLPYEDATIRNILLFVLPLHVLYIGISDFKTNKYSYSNPFIDIFIMGRDV